MAVNTTTAVAGVGVALATYQYLKNRGRPPYPPGPRPLPLLGNALQMPTHHEWITFAEWGKQYGPISHVSIFGQSIIVLNSISTINELFDKRSGIYSDRPILPMAGELVGYTHSPPLCPAGDRHRAYRKLLHAGLALNKVESYAPVQEQKMCDFLHNLLVSPEKLPLHIRNVIAAIVFQVSHGYTVKGENDALVELAERATLEFSLASAPGAFLVDLLPALKYVPDWVPGAGFKKTAKAWRQTADALKDQPYQDVKQKVKQGAAAQSFTSDLIEGNPNATPEEEDIYKWASTGFYSAGADTTVSAISSFFLAMTLYPEVQRKAREEIDRVVGHNRLPNYSDRADLPYVEALLKEVLRWNPVAPLALPHRVTLDDVYEGYLIPAGAIIFANTWGIFKDPSLYDKPDEFNPERFLQNADIPDPKSFAFGYGRRICPGQHLADASLFLTIVSTLAVFEITCATDEKTGKPIVPVPNYKAGVICHPEEYKCSIKPRFSEAELLQHIGK